jgi:hypothetical protein
MSFRTDTGYRIEGCACGGVIVAMGGPGPIAAAVEAHRTTPEHRRWPGFEQPSFEVPLQGARRVA